jgi:hypothetical protein
MGCGCGGKSANSLAYQVTWVNAEGERTTEFVADIGAYRILRKTVESQGGAVSGAIQVPRRKMEEWAAKRGEAA